MSPFRALTSLINLFAHVSLTDAQSTAYPCWTVLVSHEMDAKSPCRANASDLSTALLPDMRYTSGNPTNRPRVRAKAQS